MKHLLDKLLGKATKTAGALAIYRTEEGRWMGYGIVLKQRHDLVTVEQQWQGMTDEPGFSEAMPRTIPYVLIADGKGLLHKAIPAAQTPLLNRIRETMPGIAPKDFYLQLTSGSDKDFISVVRRDLLEPLLAQWQKAGYWITGLSLGPFAAALPVSLLTPDKDGSDLTASSFVWPLNGQYLVFDREKPSALLPGMPHLPAGYQLIPDTVAIGDQELERPWLPAYGAALSRLLYGAVTPLAQADTLDKQAAEWRYRQRFQKSGKGVLAGVFTLLLINFLAFQHFDQAASRLDEQLGQQTVSSQSEKELIQRLEEKRQFLAVNGWLSPTRHSFFADTLAATLPPGIRLTQLGIYPKDEALSRQENRTVFTTHAVMVKGLCTTPDPLREWIAILERAPWIEYVSQPGYQYDAQIGSGVFTVWIHTRPE